MKDGELIAEENLTRIESIRRRVTQSARLSQFLELIDKVLDPQVTADSSFAPLIRLATLLAVLFFLLICGWLFGVFLTWGTILVVALVHLSAKSVKADEEFYHHLFGLFASGAGEEAEGKEACEWMNYITEKFWGSVVEEIVLGIVPTIHKQLDALDALKGMGMRVKIKEVHIGRTPPRCRYMQVERTQRYDSIILKTESVFASDDMRIVMEVSTSAITVPVLVTNYKFQAPVRMEIDLNPDDLMASVLSISLTKDPRFSVPTVRPLKGLNVMSLIPGLPQIVQGIVKDVCREMFVYPQMMRMTFSGQILDGPMLSDTPITDIAVIHPEEIAKGELPEGWTILQRSSSLQYKADLNSGSSAGEVYLAYKRSKHEAPITHIAVTFPKNGEDPCPSDYVSCEKSVTGRLTGNCNRKNGKKCLLAYKKDPTAEPITDIAIVIKPKDHEKTLPGYKRVRWSINSRLEANLNEDGSGDRPYITYKGGSHVDCHLHPIAISDITLIYLDKGERALPAHAVIYRTISNKYTADTNKGAGGRTVHVCYERADLFTSPTVLGDVQLVETVAGKEQVVPAGFEIVMARPCGGVADLNGGTKGPCLQFAVRRIDVQAIVKESIASNTRAVGDDVLVVTGLAVINASAADDAVPDGFEVRQPDMNTGNRKARKMMLCVRTQPLYELIAPHLSREGGVLGVTGVPANAGLPLRVAVEPAQTSTPILSEPPSPLPSFGVDNVEAHRSVEPVDAVGGPVGVTAAAAPEEVVVAIPDGYPITRVCCYIPGVDKSLPEGWTVVAQTMIDGYDADVNAGSGGKKVYIAVRRDEGKKWLTHVGIMFRYSRKQKNGEELPPGWKLEAKTVERGAPADLNTGNGGREVYLISKKDPEGQPIRHIGVIFRDAGEEVPSSHHVLERTISGSCEADLNAGASQRGRRIFLCYAGGAKPSLVPGSWKE